MPSRRPSGRCLPAVAVLGLATLVAPSASLAQFNGDPFDPFRAAYRTSSLPIAPQVMPGQVRTVTPPGLGTVPGIGQPYDLNYTIPSLAPPSASRFDRFDRLDQELFGQLGDANRRYDDRGGLYGPDEGPDAQFAEAQERRRELYLEATREQDPERKAQLLKEYRDVSRRISLGMSPSASRRSASSRARQGAGAAPDADVPETVRSYEDLARWSRLVNREALRAGVVRAGAEAGSD